MSQGAARSLLTYDFNNEVPLVIGIQKHTHTYSKTWIKTRTKLHHYKYKADDIIPDLLQEIHLDTCLVEE